MAVAFEEPGVLAALTQEHQGFVHRNASQPSRKRRVAFNLFNHPNFGPPNNSLTSPLFGQSPQTLASSLGSGGANGSFNHLYQIGGPRSSQLALKLQF